MTIAFLNQQLSFFFLLVAAGCFSGLLAGIFGIGGGLVIVPMLYKALSLLGTHETVCMHLSVGTSLAIIAPTSLYSFIEHRRRGMIDTVLLKDWVTAVPVGTVIASIAVVYVSNKVLRGIFAISAFLIGLLIFFSNNRWYLGKDIPKNPWRWFLGMVIGVLSCLIGIGGGILNNAFMILYGRSIHQAVATSTGIGVLISIPGLLGYIYAGWGLPNLPPMSIGFVNLGAALLVLPATLFVMPIGIKIPYNFGKRQLEIGFAILLFLGSFWCCFLVAF